MSEFKSLSPILVTAEEGSLWFECPGCGAPHRIMHGPGAGPRWKWNGSAEKPTFTPSILVQWDQWEPPVTTAEIREKIASGEIVQIPVKKVCHSFVTDGRIQFLSDCTHALAGKTVDLPDWDSA
jgi:hypothetical protein